ncbi:MAG: hypothetical protein LLG00_07135 [Planctomycetaceae bacterium]|nr:hypothetical protein [Planctomycetaceae bacterium]
MAAHHRANRKALETVYRVYRLPDNLRKQMKMKREKANVSLQAVIEASATQSLPKIVSALKSMGLSFDSHLSDACVGSISEVFDAEPPYTPRGCIAQAWSVAEVLRAWVKTASDDAGQP